jgi:hypothetical protein
VDPIIANPIIGELAKTLATTVAAKILGSTGSRVRRALTGTDQQRAVGRASEAGVRALLERASPALGAEEMALVRDIFARFFEEPAVGHALAGLLRGKSLPVEALARRFDAAGFDAVTLPGIDFASALAAFQVAFVDAAIEEAALQGLMRTADSRELVRLTRELVAGQQGLRAAVEGLGKTPAMERPSPTPTAGASPEAGTRLRTDSPGAPAGPEPADAAGPSGPSVLLARVQAELRWDAACRALEADEWTRAEALTREALALAPDLPDARSTLGLALAHAVLADFRRAHGPQDPAAALHAALENRGWQPIPEPTPLPEAVHWLESARAAGDDPDGRVTEALAGLYGVAERYQPMVATVEAAAAHGGDQARRRLRAPTALVALAHGCGNTPERLRTLGELVGVVLPVPEARLRRSVERMDLTRREVDAHGIVWCAMGQPAIWLAGPRPRFPTAVRIFARDEGGQRVGQACYQISEPGRPIQSPCIPPEPGATLPVAALVRELMAHFLFVAPLVE